MHTSVIITNTDITGLLIRLIVNEDAISSLVLNILKVAWSGAIIGGSSLDRAWNITLRCKCIHLEVVVSVSGLYYFDLQVVDIDWVANWISLCKSHQSASLGRFQVIDHAT